MANVWKNGANGRCNVVLNQGEDSQQSFSVNGTASNEKEVVGLIRSHKTSLIRVRGKKLASTNDKGRFTNVAEFKRDELAKHAADILGVKERNGGRSAAEERQEGELPAPSGNGN